MPVFAYRGLAPSGRNVGGVIDADSARTARGKLRELGIFPTELTAEADAALQAQAPRQWLPTFHRRLPAPELALLTRQLSTLLGAGVQLVEALGTLADQSTRPHIKRMLSQVRERVREGSSLADALMLHPEIFSDLYVGMVRVGEAAGALEPVLDRLADYSERQSEFVGKVRGALTYPVIMILAGMLIMGFLVTYVIPQVATIFDQQHAALPLMTRVLIRLSGILSNYWLVIIIALVAAIAGIMFGLSTRAGRRVYDRWILRMPYLGPTMTRIICARFARTLATLLESGVQLMPALTAVKRVVTNGLLADAVEQSRDSIREGHGMGQTLQRSGLFPPLLIEMIKVGERSGELEQMLQRVADNYEREVDASLGQLTTLLGPLMTILMGAVILIMMLSILQPIFQLNQMMQ
ncbi:MAG TPA: type II secretion system inner membrane protein GspF [Candidatus Binataceae bacterium]|nr:type II secretion system inner membrane protein GspF [Candidatus Binataceae bacterium]